MGEPVSFSLSTSSKPEVGFAGASALSLHLCGQRVLEDGDGGVGRVEFHAGRDGKQITVRE